MNQSWVRFLPRPVRAQIEGRAYLQNVVANTGWQFADNIVRMGVGLAVGIWLARYLGPERYGLLSYALAFAALFSPLVSLGLEDIVVRNLVRDPAAKEETLGTSLVLKLSGGLLGFVAAIGTIFFLRPDDGLSQGLVAIIVAGTVFQGVNTIECWFNSQVQAKYVVFAKSAAFLLCSAIKIGLILTSAPVLAFAWVISLEIVAGSVGLFIVYISLGNRIQDWRFGLGRAISLLKDGWPLLFSGVFVMVYMRIDQVMLGQMVGSEEVGIYSVAVRLTDVWLFIPQMIFMSVFPAVVEARMTDETMLYDRLQKLYNLMALTAYAVAVPVTLFSNLLVGSLFGETYARAGLMLAVLIWANLFSSFEIARSSFLTSMNWTRIQLVTLILGGVLNIALNLLLIPRYGGMGAVVASLISYWFACHGSCFLFKPLFRTGIMLTKAMLYPKIW
ncbi:MAG: flippase [Pseudomonadota bacterium]